MTDFPSIPLGEVATVRSGFAFKSKDWTQSGVPVVKIANVKLGGLDMSGCSFVDESVAASVAEFELHNGDILISMTGYVGQVAAVRSKDLPAILNQRVGRFSIKDTKRLDRLFLYYCVSNPNFRERVEALGYGSAQPNVSPTTIHGLEIPLPAINDQTAIAALLQALEDKIELNRRMNETLEEVARAIFKDWFVDFGPTRAKMEGREPYLAPELWAHFPDRLNEETSLPEDWAFRPVSDFANLNGGKQLNKKKIVASGPIPVFGGAGIMGYTENHNAEGYVICVVRVGAYCGQFFGHRGKAWINNNASLIAQREDVPGEWLLTALKNADIDKIKPALPRWG